MRHNLRKYLGEVSRRLERFPKGVRICWATQRELAGHFPGARFGFWAVCHRPTKLCPFYVIGVARELQRAPAYVLRVLILHEALHAVITPHVGAWHPYAFRQAERSHPDSLRAQAWLASHVSTVTNTGRASKMARTSGSASLKVSTAA